MNFLGKFYKIIRTFYYILTVIHLDGGRIDIMLGIQLWRAFPPGFFHSKLYPKEYVEFVMQDVERADFFYDLAPKYIIYFPFFALYFRYKHIHPELLFSVEIKISDLEFKSKQEKKELLKSFPM